MTSLKPYITIKTYIAILGIICLLAINGVSAKFPVHKDDGEVSTMLTAGSKDAIFSSRAGYTFNVKNATEAPQTGTVS